jgi:hypothetical protein
MKVERNKETAVISAAGKITFSFRQRAFMGINSDKVINWQLNIHKKIILHLQGH